MKRPTLQMKKQSLIPVRIKFLTLLLLSSCVFLEQKNKDFSTNYDEINMCLKLAFQSIQVENEFEKSINDEDSIVLLKRQIQIDSIFYQDEFLFPEMESVKKDSFDYHFKPNFDSLRFFINWGRYKPQILIPAEQSELVYGVSEIWISKDESSLCFQIKSPYGGGRIHGFYFVKKDHVWVISESKILFIS